MSESKERRIEDLPRIEEELTPEEAEQVEGGVKIDFSRGAVATLGSSPTTLDTSVSPTLTQTDSLEKY
jgi:hypothetical protein